MKQPNNTTEITLPDANEGDRRYRGSLRPVVIVLANVEFEASEMFAASETVAGFQFSGWSFSVRTAAGAHETSIRRYQESKC